jgi:hypothetical protein
MSNKKAKARCLNQSAGRQDVLVPPPRLPPRLYWTDSAILGLTVPTPATRRLTVGALRRYWLNECFILTRKGDYFSIPKDSSQHSLIFFSPNASYGSQPL